ncbi:fluoride efflux transporter FluC [Agrococcus sp. SGAir0287]|uniref:fluoride efflux transporter FluC n=1 Tax=Agrococcus sp. SGAir0287 TaxID=2070347 RepID=UPI0010CCD497|nr:CrcB family protein [Agrococcus sp. SGAir0287]QCR18377.1 CrcB family protein [Agrococcus sp. SGAir0287]
MRRALPWLAVLVGGALGTALRAGIDLATPSAHPWPTLGVNVAGALALGLLVARVWPIAPEWLRAGLGTGLLGGFTTFSALALVVAQRPDAEALVYAAASIVLGIAAAWLGLRLGGRPRAALEVDE